MQIEVVEYYPLEIKGEDTTGSLHVFICELGLDLRGIWVKKVGKVWQFFLPTKITKDIDTKEDVRFPVFNFTDPKRNKELMSEIRKEGRKYICENYLKVEKPKRPKYYERPQRSESKGGKFPNKRPEDRKLWKRPMGPRTG